MGRGARSGVIALAVSLLAAVPATAGASTLTPPADGGGVIGLAGNPGLPHARDHVLVRLDPDVAPFRTLRRASSRLAGGWRSVSVPSGVEPIDYVTTLAGHPGVGVAELDIELSPLGPAAPLVPDDPLYLDGTQWNLPDIGMPSAWSRSTGAAVRVAVLDTGVDRGPADGFCNPFVDEYDAVLGATGPGSAFDPDGHGTHVAGTVAQCSGNGIGAAGVAPGASIMPVAVLDAARFISQASWLAAGIHWAIDHGARVINISLGCSGGCASSVISDALARAHAAGVVVVVASGNDGGPLAYPASEPGVIAVGASTKAHGIASYSSRGPELDMVAPGGADISEGIVQESFFDGPWGYYRSTGTSMAAPHVAGAAAVLLADRPAASAGQVKAAIECSTVDLGTPGVDDQSGTGLLQVDAALDAVEALVAGGRFPCGARTKLAFQDPGSGIWRLFYRPGGYAQMYYGNPGDVPVMGDWDCDGVDTPGLYRQSDGYAYLRNSATQGVADVRFFFGNPGDVPIAGDWNGDGCDTLSIYRPAEGRFYVINRLGQGDAGLGAADYAFYFGDPGDKPFVGDFDGDAVDEVGLHRETTGRVYFRFSLTQGVADRDFIYGDPGDQVISGDWNLDGKESVGLYRPSDGTVYLRYANTQGVADESFFVGYGYLAAAGKF